ncbi:hypothetical protein ACOMHN_052585 [Nucella lapillus]
MSLPRIEDLSRWTVTHVNNWLTQSSLTAFRDDFLRDNIDGCKLMRMQPRDVDVRYGSIPDRKRQILKDHLSRIETPKSPPSWNVAAPQIPPRSGDRAPAALPQSQEEGDDSDDGWGSEFEDIDEEYLEPTLRPEHIRQADAAAAAAAAAAVAAQGSKLNGHPQPPPPDPEESQLVYEIPTEELEGLSIQHAETKGLKRKASLVDRLKNELINRKRESQAEEISEEDSEEAIYIEPVTALCSGDSGEMSAPPRPGRKLPGEKPPPPPPAQQGGWLFSNEQATAPANKDDLSSFPWYHGKIGRDHAQRIFAREQKEGMFLIRKSERDPQQPYTLVIWHSNRIWNIPIRKAADGKYAAGKYKQGETHFASLPDLVDHFKMVSLNLKSEDQVQGTHNLTVSAPQQ